MPDCVFSWAPIPCTRRCWRPRGGRMKPLHLRDVLVLLRRDVDRAGGQSEWSRQTGISRTYINRVLNGRKPPGPGICRALRLERAVLRDVAKRVDATRLRPVDPKEVPLILQKEIKRAGSISAWCRQVGLDRSNLSQVLHKRRGLGNKILAALRLSNALLDADVASATRQGVSGSKRRRGQRYLRKRLGMVGDAAGP
jgi:DNA-binding transcriptional regulator YdaS (Cro superfamily)